MLPQQPHGPNDATHSTGIGNNALPPTISEPAPRRALNYATLSSDRDDTRHYSTQRSHPSAQNQRFHDHSRDQIRTPSRGATSIRSSVRPTPSPASNGPEDRFLTRDLDTNSVQNVNININVTHSTPPSPNPPPPQHLNQAADAAGSGLDDSDRRATPGQRNFQSRLPPPGNLHSWTPPVRHRSPSEPGHDDSGYLSLRPPVLANSPARLSPIQFQDQPQGTGDTTWYQNQAGMILPMNQGHPISPPQVNRSADQQRSSGSSRQASRSPAVSSPATASSRPPSVNAPQSHTNPTFPLDPGSMMSPTNQGRLASPLQVNRSADQQRSSGSSRQASRSPAVSSPATASSRPPSVNPPQSHTSPTSPLDLGRFSHTVPTPERSARRQTNNNLSLINTSFVHPVGAQSDGRPRSSQSWSSQHTASHGPAPTNGNGNDANIESVVDNLLRVPPTHTVWRTQRGVLTLTNSP
ncbi:hypothetical protein BJ322DRAFT_787696 [Thelephora terrestris]|uniref:Uncharacterized protein n=1 Tax=Thelephora terrestris TaxID=56493 RepID=A0A9P6L7W3_9AGAM|nr:hypothetical protein BJ322DRAFT_787696 [Thelephora terrestris]